MVALPPGGRVLSRCVQNRVHGIRAGAVAEGQRPGIAKAIVVRPAAFGAGPVPGGKRGGLIQEEQFGVAAGLHQGATAALEGQQAGDPAAALMRADNPAVRIVQAAAVAHQGAAGGVGNDLARGQDAVLAGQGR